MQVQTDSNSSNRVGVEEDSINFRPSPNFKKMKKFFKLKLDYIENKMKGVSNVVEDPPPQPNAEKNEKKSEVQPPLPLDPPPTDQLPLNKQVKTELDIDPQSNSDKSDMLSDTVEMEAKPKYASKKKVDICRDYIRGTCRRTGCKYAHKNDVTQEDLYGVYVFCREYQSKVCTRAHCKYVHASVFEEQEYYRSRYLPPHTFAHLNNNHVLLPPPPPPPEEPTVNFAIPPPPLQNELEKQTHSMVNCMPATVFKKPLPVSMTPTLPAPMAPPIPATPPVATPGKRDWNIVEPFNNPDCIDPSEPVAKKCKQCDTMEFRYQYNKDKVEKMRLAKEEMNKKIILLDKNSEKLNKCIQALLIRTLVPKSGNLAGLDKEKSLSDLVSALSTMNGMVCDDK